MGEMSNSMIACLNNVRDLEDHYLTWNRREDDIPDPITWNHHRNANLNPADNKPTRPRVLCYQFQRGNARETCSKPHAGQQMLQVNPVYDAHTHLTCREGIISSISTIKHLVVRFRSIIHKMGISRTWGISLEVEPRTHHPHRESDTAHTLMQTSLGYRPCANLRESFQKKLNAHIADNMWKEKELVQL